MSPGPPGLTRESCERGNFLLRTDERIDEERILLMAAAPLRCVDGDAVPYREVMSR
jgi:hypothetical protein